MIHEEMLLAYSRYLALLHIQLSYVYLLPNTCNNKKFL